MDRPFFTSSPSDSVVLIQIHCIIVKVYLSTKNRLRKNLFFMKIPFFSQCNRNIFAIFELFLTQKG
ncbi:hypothetical protein D0X72_10440 [Listeria monocytogenes]|uniref:Uncharacterized protein n=1 Tax=Listeria monocytogenes TaxID=1639 RepID=A0A9P1XDJ3_LISMN|nr:hypothetical protein B0X25_01545 [Listeria monocytogenes]EAD3236132.1 hypothetical protein [Listeria monocytogenes CFSAN002202]EAE3703626.1 hypothetical protein [Listeria monocytogenes serotype 1/2c]EAF3063923.1 hypothetical protein [Listeria monocytogenes serotype 1/2a]EAF4502063.1 hypothetical protein [Listeria monocytogenes serotype 4b]EAG6270958.1 hypothetical protein [Listeria monocytogenes CFSAN003726]EAG6272797.1 hypothetical protein [Listeria monocytogenes CFSAN003808]EAG6280381.1